VGHRRQNWDKQLACCHGRDRESLLSCGVGSGPSSVASVIKEGYAKASVVWPSIVERLSVDVLQRDTGMRSSYISSTRQPSVALLGRLTVRTYAIRVKLFIASFSPEEYEGGPEQHSPKLEQGRRETLSQVKITLLVSRRPAAET